MTETSHFERTDDDRAVSPVIGVILMVAITVILAAVIGTFVLDLGQSAGKSAPQASLSVTVNQNTDNVTVKHTGGDAIDQSQTRVMIDFNNGTTMTWEPATTSQTLGVGQSTTFETSVPNAAGRLNGLTASAGTSAHAFQANDQITVTVIDTESQRQIFETTVTA